MATSILDMVDSGDVGLLVCLTLLLLVVGNWLVGKDEIARRRGGFTGAIVFVAYLLYGVTEDGFSDIGLLIIRVIRASVAAGISVGVAWMILPFISIAERKRTEFQRESKLRREKERTDCEEQQQKAQLIESQRQLELERARTAPEREREALLKAEAAERQAQIRGREAVQRDAARIECQLLYDRHAESLIRLFPRDRFDAFVQQWLTNDRCAADVQNHAKRLCELIADLANQAAPARKRFGSLREISEHFAARRSEVLAGLYDAETESTLIAAINDHETTAFTEFLKN